MKDGNMEEKSTSLGVIILTLNEEANLSLALDSVYGWADEVLIVDSYSSDDTLNIANRYDIRVLQNLCSPFLISRQRNWALENGGMNTDWILFLDADEIITSDLKQVISETLCDVSAEIAAFQLTPKFMFMGRWLRWCVGYPNWHDRLMRVGQVSFAGGVWEHFETKGKIGRIEQPYLHYGFNKGFNEWIERHNRYSDFEARDVLETLGINNDHFGEALTKRRRTLRNLAARFWPLRPVIRFFYMYFWRFGFLDGIPGLLYCMMMGFYEFMVVLKVIEMKRRAMDLPV